MALLQLLAQVSQTQERITQPRNFPEPPFVSFAFFIIYMTETLRHLISNLCTIFALQTIANNLSSLA